MRAGHRTPRFFLCALWRDSGIGSWPLRIPAFYSTAHRREIELRAIDTVNIDDVQSERDHGYQGESATEGYFEGKRTREARGGWFSYQLKVAPGQPVTLVCAYRGSEGRRRTFDILVDGEKIATESLEYHPTEQLDREYPLPDALTRGKDRVTIKFQAQAQATAGAVIDLRTVAGGPPRQ